MPDENDKTGAAGAVPESSFALPDELKGKGAEDIARYYTERYKDYDDLKGKAAQVDSWSKFGKPEEVESRLSTFDKVAGALRQGKVIVADGSGQLYAKDVSDLTPAERRQAQSQTPATSDSGDWTDGYDLLAPTDQGRRLEKHMQSVFNSIIEAKAREYGEQIAQFQQGQWRQMDTLLNMLAQIQDHPELKIRDVLRVAGELGSKGAADPMKAAFDQFLTPAQVKAQAEKMAAEIIAEKEAKAQKERAERTLNGGNANGNPLQRMFGNRNERMTNDKILANLRDKGLLQ